MDIFVARCDCPFRLENFEVSHAFPGQLVLKARAPVPQGFGITVLAVAPCLGFSGIPPRVEIRAQKRRGIWIFFPDCNVSGVM
jgi:hypothetical protein